MIYSISSSQNIYFKGLEFEKAEEKLYRYEKQGDYLLFLYKFNPGTDEIPGLINLSVVKFIEINSIKYFFWGKDQKNDKFFLIND
jgi:hypothetical protein